jgi:branched-chain amino acid transport system ATP-binding protein/urea transport system ATP-binding protein
VARLGVGIKTQVPSLFDGLCAFDSIVLSVRRRKGEAEARRRAGDVLQQLGITALADQTVGRLAHGQRQLVELAIVIAPGPDLIILDEPTAGMSAEETRRTADVIRMLNRDHAIVVVEHDMQFIRAIAHRVTVFHQGRVLMEDDAATVFADPRVRDVYLGRAAA